MVLAKREGAIAPQSGKEDGANGALDVSGLYSRLQLSMSLASVERHSQELNEKLDAREKEFEAAIAKAEADVRRFQAMRQREQSRINDLLSILGDL